VPWEEVYKWGALIVLLALGRLLVRVIRYRGFRGALYGSKVGECIGTIESRSIPPSILAGKISVRQLTSEPARVGIDVWFGPSSQRGSESYSATALTVTQARELIYLLETAASEQNSPGR